MYIKNHKYLSMPFFATRNSKITWTQKISLITNIPITSKVTMAWESCVLLLNSDSTDSFYTGNIVTGSVILEFKNRQQVENMAFKVIGISRAQWTRPMPTIPYFKIYSQKNIVFNQKFNVFSELNGKTILPGILKFPFHFVLPYNLPSSFESSIAKVYYFIKIKGKAAFKLSKQKIVQFKVVGNINLNGIEEYLVPKYVEREKIFWNSQKISIKLKTYRAFAPKQNVPFKIDIVNQNEVKLSKIIVFLMQKIRYTIFSGWADEEKKIHKVEYCKFSNTVFESCHFNMEVPQTIPTSLNVTDLMISVSYFLRVEVIFPFHSRLREDVPVIISTVPVMHSNF